MPDSDREGQALSPASAGAQAAPPCGTPARQLNANAPPMNPIRNSDGLSPSEFSLSGISLSRAVQRRDRNRHHALMSRHNCATQFLEVKRGRRCEFRGINRLMVKEAWPTPRAPRRPAADRGLGLRVSRPVDVTELHETNPVPHFLQRR